VLVVEGRLEGMNGAEGSGITDRELAMSFPANQATCSTCARSSRWSTS
jgi:hypothetical protein